jgi:GT2 family glycosyltransferase
MNNGKNHSSGPLPDRLSGPLPPASVVVVSYNTAAHIERCIRSILDLDYPEVEIIVVDNASTDSSAELIAREFPQVELVPLPDNKGFAGGASVGLYMASGEIVATVNPDVTLDRGWMRAMAAALDREEVGIVGSRILYPDGVTLQHAGGMVHYPLATTSHVGRGERDEGQYNLSRPVSFVTGAALAMRRDVGKHLGFFDEEFFPVYYEDVDLCWRADREGLSTVYEPSAVAYHEETVTLDRGGSRYYGFYHANRYRFVMKHYLPEQIMLDFLPAEAARVSGDMPAADRKASLGLLDSRLTPNHEGGENGDHEPGPEVVPLDRRWTEMQARAAEVEAGWQVYERAHGKTERGGRLRNLLRRLYVWPVVNRQIEYNASLARAVRDLSQQVADLQARVAVQGVMAAGLASRQGDGVTDDLSIEIEDLRARIEQLERQASIRQVR